MYRILRGIVGKPDMKSARLKYCAVKDVTPATIIELYRDIGDIFQPSSSAFYSSANHPAERRRGQSEGARPLLPNTDYLCMLCCKDVHAANDYQVLRRLLQRGAAFPKGKIVVGKHDQALVESNPSRKKSRTSNVAHGAQGYSLTPDEALMYALSKSLASTKRRRM